MGVGQCILKLHFTLCVSPSIRARAREEKPSIFTCVSVLRKGYNKSMNNYSPPGVRVAKLILSGDIELARDTARLVHGTLPPHWSVPEAYAIVGACRVVQKRGWPVTPESFGL